MRIKQTLIIFFNLFLFFNCEDKVNYVSNNDLKNLEQSVSDSNNIFLDENNVTIKCHCLMHCGRSARFINPRLSICYSGEDYMKHIKNLMHSVISGHHAVRAGRVLVEKIRMAMHVDFSKDRWFQQ